MKIVGKGKNEIKGEDIADVGHFAMQNSHCSDLTEMGIFKPLPVSRVFKTQLPTEEAHLSQWS